MTAEAVPLAPVPEGWTIEDVDSLPEDGTRWELVDGVPRAMPPARTKHQRAQYRLHGAIEATAPAGLTVIECVGVILAPDQRPIPDVVVVRDADDETYNYPAEQVVLASEIVSRSSRSDDRFRKPAQYAQAGIPCYLRVELDPPLVVAYVIGADGWYVEAGRAEPGELLTLNEPFPISFDPAVLLR